MSIEGNRNPVLPNNPVTKEEVSRQVLMASDLLDLLMQNLEVNCQVFKNQRTALLLDLKEGLNSAVLAQVQSRKGTNDERNFLQEEQVELLKLIRKTETNYEDFKKELAELYNNPYGICPELAKNLKQIVLRFEMIKLDITENKNVHGAALSKMFKFLDSQKESCKETRKNNSQNLVCLDNACEQLDEECNKVKCDLMRLYETILWTLINAKKSIDGERFETPVEQNHEAKQNLLAEYYDDQKKEFHTTFKGLVNEIQELVGKNSANQGTEMEQAKRDKIIMKKLENIKLFAKRFACPDDEDSNEVNEDVMDQD